MSKLTKEQLHGMSDSSVNKALEQLTGMYCEDCAGKYINTMDYCNTPNDIMPLAFEHWIGVVCNRATWVAFLYKSVDDGVEFQDKNPLRAIACCLILVLQEKS